MGDQETSQLELAAAASLFEMSQRKSVQQNTLVAAADSSSKQPEASVSKRRRTRAKRGKKGEAAPAADNGTTTPGMLQPVTGATPLPSGSTQLGGSTNTAQAATTYPAPQGITLSSLSNPRSSTKPTDATSAAYNISTSTYSGGLVQHGQSVLPQLNLQPQVLQSLHELILAQQRSNLQAAVSSAPSTPASKEGTPSFPYQYVGIGRIPPSSVSSATSLPTASADHSASSAPASDTESVEIQNSRESSPANQPATPHRSPSPPPPRLASDSEAETSKQKLPLKKRRFIEESRTTEATTVNEFKSEVKTEPTSDSVKVEPKVETVPETVKSEPGEVARPATTSSTTVAATALARYQSMLASMMSSPQPLPLAQQLALLIQKMSRPQLPAAGSASADSAVAAAALAAASAAPTASQTPVVATSAPVMTPEPATRSQLTSRALQLQHMKELIRIACNPDDEGDLPLHIAVCREDISAVHKAIVLMKVGNKPIDTRNNLKQTPLHIAIYIGQVQATTMLLENGADPGVQDRHGNTCLHIAVEHGRIDCLKIIFVLSKHPVPVDEPNFNGFTALHLAVLRDSVAMVELLLQNKADKDVQDNKSGGTPLFHACEGNRRTIVELLLKYKANVDQSNFMGNTPLHAACGRELHDVMMLLVQSGADLTARNSNGETVSLENIPSISAKTTPARTQHKRENSSVGLKAVSTAGEARAVSLLKSASKTSAQTVPVQNAAGPSLVDNAQVRLAQQASPARRGKPAAARGGVIQANVSPNGAASAPGRGTVHGRGGRGAASRGTAHGTGRGVVVSTAPGRGTGTVSSKTASLQNVAPGKVVSLLTSRSVAMVPTVVDNMLEEASVKLDLGDLQRPKAAQTAGAVNTLVSIGSPPITANRGTTPVTTGAMVRDAGRFALRQKLLQATNSPRGSPVPQRGSPAPSQGNSPAPLITSITSQAAEGPPTKQLKLGTFNASKLAVGSSDINSFQGQVTLTPANGTLVPIKSDSVCKAVEASDSLNTAISVKKSTKADDVDSGFMSFENNPMEYSTNSVSKHERCASVTPPLAGDTPQAVDEGTLSSEICPQKMDVEVSKAQLPRIRNGSSSDLDSSSRLVIVEQTEGD